MKRLLLILGGVIAATAGVTLVWRKASERISLPCPSTIAGFLHVPFMESVRGAEAILDRLDLHPGMTLLDAGCGPGRVSLPAARRVAPGGEVIAFDLQPAMLAKLDARAKAEQVPGIRTIQGKLGSGSLPANLCDRAILVTVLGEVPDRAAALKEIFHSLKSNGILSDTEVFPDPHFLTQGTVRRLAEGAGFRVGDVFGGPLAFTIHLIKDENEENDR